MMKTLMLAALLVLTAVAFVPQASANPCYENYSRTDVGTLSVVRRDSCAPPELYQCPTPGAPLDQCTDLLRLG